MRYFLLSICLCFCVCLSAQYYVYSVNGKAYIYRNDTQLEVFSTMQVYGSDYLQTTESGSIVIIDRAQSRCFTLQSVYPTTVQELISNTHTFKRTLAKEFVQGMIAKLFGSDSDESEHYNTSGGVTYRSDDVDLQIASAVDANITSAYDVSFSLLDYLSGERLSSVREGQLVVLSVSNKSDVPLFVNFIDIDAGGVLSALFGHGDVDVLDLYIPAMSQVRLSKYPVSFAPGGSSDNLVMVAYPLPFDIENVVNYLQKMSHFVSGESANAVGVSRSMVDIIP